jgi:hypothetical protein
MLFIMVILADNALPDVASTAYEQNGAHGLAFINQHVAFTNNGREEGNLASTSSIFSSSHHELDRLVNPHNL